MAADPIVSVAVYTATLPLAEAFEHASSGVVDRLEEVVVKVTTASGAVGWSEVRGNAPYVTGETRDRVVAALRDVFAPRLVAAKLTSVAEVSRFLDGAAMGNSTARAAIDIAVHEARARAAGLPVQDMLGGGGVTELKIHGSMPFCAPEEAARRTTSYLDRGIRKVKVRIGISPGADMDRLEAIHAAIRAHPAAAETVMAADANQAWGAKEAIRRLKPMEKFGLAWIEQPVKAGDIAGMKEVRHAIDAPLVADESCGTPADLLRLIEARAADAFHFKLCKAGGIRKLMGMIATAEAAGLGYMVGQMDEGMLATAAGLHCAAAARPFSCELWGYQRVGSQPFSGLEMVDGAVRLPGGPGFGIAVDEAGLTEVAHFGARTP